MSDVLRSIREDCIAVCSRWGLGAFSGMISLFFHPRMLFRTGGILACHWYGRVWCVVLHCLRPTQSQRGALAFCSRWRLGLVQHWSRIFGVPVVDFRNIFWDDFLILPAKNALRHRRIIGMPFAPVGQEWQERTAAYFMSSGLQTNFYINKISAKDIIDKRERPMLAEKIEGDGNCFYRTLSHAIFGRWLRKTYLCFYTFWKWSFGSIWDSLQA